MEMVEVKKNSVIVNVDEVENFILHTKNADYTLDLKQLVSDYGVVYVVDSDKKRINEGDTVYGRRDGKAWHVIGVFGGDYPVWAVDDDGNSRDLKPEWLTHNEPEPDTFEKIEEDAKLSIKDYCTKWFGSFSSQSEMKKSDHIIMRCKKIYNDSVKHPNADFDWKAFKNGEIAVHCKTDDEALAFLESVKNNVFITDYSISPLKTWWDENKDKTCYVYNKNLCEVRLNSYHYFEKNYYTIVEWRN